MKELEKEIRMKRHYGIKGPALSANMEGLTNNAGSPAPTRFCFAGWRGPILLDQLNLSNQFKYGVIETVYGEGYSVGTIAGVYLRTDALRVMMFEKASRNGPATKWVWTHVGDDLSVELGVGKFRFVHVGVGANEDMSGLFAQSLHNGTKPTPALVTLFPAGGEISVEGRMAMYDRVADNTVLPPEDEETSSIWWRRPKPWLRDRTGSFPLSFA